MYNGRTTMTRYSNEAERNIYDDSKLKYLGLYKHITAGMGNQPQMGGNYVNHLS